MSNFNTRINLFLRFCYTHFLYFYIFPSWFKYQAQELITVNIPVYYRTPRHEKKNVIRLIVELIFLTIRFCCIPFHYMRYSLYEKKIKWASLKNYMPDTEFYYKYIPSFNGNMFLLDDKNVFEDICKSSNLPIPKTILKIKNGIIFDGNGRILYSIELAIRYLNSISSDSIVCKPAKNSSGGKGIFILNRLQYVWHNDNVVFTNEEFHNLLHDDWIFQEQVYNCNEISILNIPSLCCIRVLTVLSGNEAKPMYALLKMNSENNIVDNVSMGGIYIGIDMVSGTLLEIGHDNNRNIYKSFPNSNIRFNSFTIPLFQDVKKYAKDAALAFSDLKIVGWDIAVTAKGVVLIEGNSSPAIDIIQHSHQGVPELFIELLHMEKLKSNAKG